MPWNSRYLLKHADLLFTPSLSKVAIDNDFLYKRKSPSGHLIRLRRFHGDRNNFFNFLKKIP